MKKLLIIAFILIYACGGGDVDRWEYINSNKKFDKKTGQTYLKVKDGRNYEEFTFTTIPPNVKNEIDTFRSEMPSLADWDDERIYRTLKKENPNLIWNEYDEWSEKWSDVKPFKYKWVKE